MYASHTTNFLEGPHFNWRGPQMYWPATTHTHHPYRTSQVLWPYCTCWSINGPQPRVQVQCGPLTKGLELQIWPSWSGNCLSSTKLTGTEVVRGSGYVHSTSHMMMMMMIMTLYTNNLHSILLRTAWLPRLLAWTSWVPIKFSRKTMTTK